MDGSRLLKVLVGKKDQDSVDRDGKADAVKVVFKKLTNKDVALEFV